MKTILHVSASSIKMFESCPAQWRNEYLLGNRGPSGIYADIGTAVHEVVQDYLNCIQNDPTNHPSLVCIPDQKERDLAVKYALAREGKRARLVGTEIEVLLQIKDNLPPIKAFFDAVYWHPGDILEIEDHKTNRSYEPASEWAIKIQQRIYPLLARILWPQAKKIRFTIGYVMLDKIVEWETDPEWDIDTMERVLKAWEGMNQEQHEEKVGDHCRWCQLTGVCGSYQSTIRGFESSLLPMLREEHPAEALGRLKSVKKLVEQEIEQTQTRLIKMIEEQGSVIAAGRVWSMTEKKKRNGPKFTEFYAAIHGSEGYDQDAMQIFFEHADDLLTVKLGPLDDMMKASGTIKSRVSGLISRTTEKALSNSPEEKIVKNSRKKKT